MQSTPDYVLNPLSIFRMARKSIPERHAPESAGSSSAPNSTRPDSMPDLDQSVGENGEGAQGNSTNDNAIHQGSLEELQTLFMSDLGWAWQPAETAVGSGIDGAGLLPWAGGYPSTQTEPWLPVFPFPQQDWMKGSTRRLKVPNKAIGSGREIPNCYLARTLYELSWNYS